MQIKTEYGNMERRERALLLTGVAGKMRDIPDGSTAKATAFVNYLEGEQELLAVRFETESGEEWYTTNSKSFTRSFLAIASCYPNEDFFVTKISGTSRSGRVYIDCTPA